MRTTIKGYITDKSNNKYFQEYNSEEYIDSLKRTLNNHLESAKKHPLLYNFLDLGTAKIIIEKL